MMVLVSNAELTSSIISKLIEKQFGIKLAIDVVVPAPVAPKSFGKLPKEVAESGLPKADLMRLSTIYELIETEIDYGKDLHVMINVQNS